MRRIVLLALCLESFATAPPSRPSDLCAIFQEKPEWYLDAREAFHRWEAPIPLQMAIISQESSYVEDARPPRRRFLGIPLWRPSTAFGYAQAKDETWERYRDATGQSGAERNEFADAVDFVAWYIHQSKSQLGVGEYDAYNQYLAYHEGLAGFRRASWTAKPALQRSARQVQALAWRYGQQLRICTPLLEQAASE